MIENQNPQVGNFKSWEHIKARLIKNLQKQSEIDCHIGTGFCNTKLFNEEVTERFNGKLFLK